MLLRHLCCRLSVLLACQGVAKACAVVPTEWSQPLFNCPTINMNHIQILPQARRMSSSKREPSRELADEYLGPIKRTKTRLPETPTEGPSQVSPDGTIIGDVDADHCKVITLSSATATLEEWETILTILNSPSLARHVIEVSLPALSSFPDKGEVSFQPFDINTDAERRAQRILKEAISEHGWLSEDAEWLLWAAMHRNSDALAAVLLSSCLNIEHLKVGAIERDIPRKLELIEAPPPLYAITVSHLRLSPCQELRDSEYSNYPFELFKAYAKLPRLSHLAMSDIGGIHVEDAGSYLEIPKYVSPVKHIIVKRSQMGDTCLQHVLKFARKDQLESVTYQTGGLASPDGSGAMIQPPRIWATLSNHSRTLKKLDLDFDYQIPTRMPISYPGDSEFEEQSDSDDVELEHPPFQNLTCLRIGIKALMTLMVPTESSVRLVNVLPPNLEELVIRGYDQCDAQEDVKTQLDEVKQKMGTGRLSKLKVLEGVDELIENGEDFEGEDDEWEDDGGTGGDSIWK